jgi:putative transposase
MLKKILLVTSLLCATTPVLCAKERILLHRIGPSNSTLFIAKIDGSDERPLLFVEIANGKSTPQACKEAEITVQTYYRWRKEFGGLKLDQAKRLKELERENAKLKRLVAELSLEKQILKDVASGNF